MAWRVKKANSDIIIMADINKFIGERKDLYDFCQHNDLVDAVFLIGPDIHEDPTYLWGSKRIDNILIPPTLAEIAVKAGHHQFNQHFISDHKGGYLQFYVKDIFDTSTMDRRHASYRRLRMNRKDTTHQYISHLEGLYKENSTWQ